MGLSYRIVLGGAIEINIQGGVHAKARHVVTIVIATGRGRSQEHGLAGTESSNAVIGRRRQHDTVLMNAGVPCTPGSP